MRISTTSISLVAAAFGFIKHFANAQFAAKRNHYRIGHHCSQKHSLQINTTTTNLTSASTFGDYTGTTNLTYKVRTTQSTGAGNITLKVTSDFSPAGGPSVATPPNAGDALAYTCTSSNPGTACSGSQTSSTSSPTPVVSFGAGANSAIGGNSASVAWDLTNDPAYKTGSYSATVTFTVSAT